MIHLHLLATCFKSQAQIPINHHTNYMYHKEVSCGIIMGYVLHFTQVIMPLWLVVKLRKFPHHSRPAWYVWSLQRGSRNGRGAELEAVEGWAPPVPPSILLTNPSTLTPSEALIYTSLTGLDPVTSATWNIIDIDCSFMMSFNIS